MIVGFCILSEENERTLKVSYRTRAIITRSLYILNPLFECQKRFFKEFFLENSQFIYGWLVLKSGL